MFDSVSQILWLFLIGSGFGFYVMLVGAAYLLTSSSCIPDQSD